MVAVMGDTSSGKSSLLSSLIGLDLPSASTLTTKCPIVIQLVQKAVASDSDGEKEKGKPTMEASVRIVWQSTSQSSTSTHSSPARDRKREIEHHKSMPPSFDETGTASPPPPPPPTFAPIQLIGAEEVAQRLSTCIQQAQQHILEHRSPARIAPDQIHVTVVQRSVTPTSTASTTSNSNSNAQSNTNTNTTLTLVDLPGLVQYDASSDDEKKVGDNGNDNGPSLQQQVHDVMQAYCANPNCFVLAVLPAPVDIHNSSVLQWMRQPHIDPHGQRTIPVFTKPDLVDPGGETPIIELMRRDENENENGPAAPAANSTHPPFLVKNRGQAARDDEQGVADGWQEEMEYFANPDGVWHPIPSDRLGISNLRQYLVEMQWRCTRRMLPSLIEDLVQQRTECQHELAQIGTPFATPLERRQCYQSMVQHFCRSLEGSLSGKIVIRQGTHRRSSRNHDVAPINGASNKAENSNSSNDQSAAMQLHRAINMFRSDIRSTPLATIKTLTEGTHVWVRSAIHPGTDVRGEIVHIQHGDSETESSYACVDYLDPRDHTTDVLFDGIGYTNPPPPPPSYLDRNVDGDNDEQQQHSGQESYQIDEVWSDGVRVYIARDYNRFDSLRKIPLSRIRTDPSWLLERMQMTDDLACFINVDQFRAIVADFVESDWVPPSAHLMDQVESILLHAVESCWDDTLNAAGEQSQPNAASSRAQSRSLSSSLYSSTSSSSSLAAKHPKLQSKMTQLCKSITLDMLQKAKAEVDDQLEMERHHPYTQDGALIQEVAKSRYANLRSDLEWQLKLHQRQRDTVVYNREALLAIFDRVFDKHQRGSSFSSPHEADSSGVDASGDGDNRNGDSAIVTMHMAEEMESVLSSYGKMATRRILDRVPMICWQVFRTLKRELQEKLLGDATDAELETDHFAELPEVKRKHEQITQKLQDVDMAIGLMEGILNDYDE